MLHIKQMGELNFAKVRFAHDVLDDLASLEKTRKPIVAAVNGYPSQVLITSTQRTLILTDTRLVVDVNFPCYVISSLQEKTLNLDSQK